jgi:hypothetical protein
MAERNRESVAPVDMTANEREFASMIRAIADNALLVHRCYDPEEFSIRAHELLEQRDWASFGKFAIQTRLGRRQYDAIVNHRAKNWEPRLVVVIIAALQLDEKDANKLVAISRHNFEVSTDVIQYKYHIAIKLAHGKPLPEWDKIIAVLGIPSLYNAD